MIEILKSGAFTFILWGCFMESKDLGLETRILDRWHTHIIEPTSYDQTLRQLRTNIELYGGAANASYFDSHLLESMRDSIDANLRIFRGEFEEFGQIIDLKYVYLTFAGLSNYVQIYTIGIENEGIDRDVLAEIAKVLDAVFPQVQRDFNELIGKTKIRGEIVQPDYKESLFFPLQEKYDDVRKPD